MHCSERTYLTVKYTYLIATAIIKTTFDKSNVMRKIEKNIGIFTDVNNTWTAANNFIDALPDNGIICGLYKEYTSYSWLYSVYLEQLFELIAREWESVICYILYVVIIYVAQLVYAWKITSLVHIIAEPSNLGEISVSLDMVERE